MLFFQYFWAVVYCLQAIGPLLNSDLGVQISESQAQQRLNWDSPATQYTYVGCEELLVAMRNHTACSVVLALLLLSLLLGPLATDARVQAGLGKKDKPNCSSIREQKECTPEGCIWCQNK
jgi:hypothetical protein